MTKGPPKRRALTPEERELWRRVGNGLTRVRKAAPAAENDSPPADSKAVRKAAPPPVKASVRTPAKPTPAPSPPQDRGGERKVRRGQVAIDATLDLHGMTYDSARAAVLQFLASAQRRGARVVIVVTGKGRAGEGALKRALPGWLAEREVRGLISGYAQAHREHGGAGAFYVFVKRAG